jgi:hypothetical protein
MILWSLIVFLMFTAGIDRFGGSIPGPPNAQKAKLIIPRIVSLGTIFFSLAILLWQKWAIWGLIVLFGFDFSIRLIMGFSVRDTVAGLFWNIVPVAILFVLLQIGGEKSGWSQMN